VSSHDTHHNSRPARHRRPADIIDIGNVLRRKRNRTVAIEASEAPPTATAAETHTAPLAPGAVIGYFRFAGYCIKVQYASSEQLWLWACAEDETTGPLASFDAYASLRYAEFAKLGWRARSLTFVYLGADVEPAWMPLPSPAQADLIRRVLSLYDYVAKGAHMEAEDDLVPNPAPTRFSATGAHT
jgi:hypothetical protein